MNFQKTRLLFFPLLIAVVAQSQTKSQGKDSIATENLNEIVVTGTKTFKRKTDSSVIVNILGAKSLKNLQSCNLSEGLKFMPGLRTETDCQTCNYTQLRIHGLPGGYSQILINGRPIFSPLMGLYGMEQLPVNMIEKIELVRGGGSSLYGSSAIAGTVNVMTKWPNKNGFEVNSFYQSMGKNNGDYNLSANQSWVNDSKNVGMTLFFNKRIRDAYDANGDNFSEIPKIENTSFGLSSFFKWNENQKIEFSVSNLNEYRFGGEMTDKEPHLTQQAEERKHDIWLASLDYQYQFDNKKTSISAFSGWQFTKRKHYTGIFPDAEDEITQHLIAPPYGNSINQTKQIGLQLNHEITPFFGKKHIWTFGTEYLFDDVLDQIPTYQYKIDQVTKNFGSFVQSDWDLTDKLNFLAGVRLDNHNLLQKPIWSPRFALLYKQKNTQYRLGYGTGFRAPQAFDSDMHIAFAGGGISRIQLHPDLQAERSKSWNASVNYDFATPKWIGGFTIEGFFTRLDRVFVLEHIGDDKFGEIFEKRNGSSAIVKGITIEGRYNFDRKIQLETGFTVQDNYYSVPVNYINGIAPTKTFLRTPKAYGFANFSWTPNEKWSANLNYVFTGKMLLAHFGGAENFETDALQETSSFSEVNTKISYMWHKHQWGQKINFYAGIKNLLNAYQKDFDLGKNRDSNYVYGPGNPRTFFVGIQISSE